MLNKSLKFRWLETVANMYIRLKETLHYFYRDSQENNFSAHLKSPKPVVSRKNVYQSNKLKKS